MMHTNPWVSVEVDDIEDLANWRSVIAWGRFEELFGDKAAAFARLRARFEALVASETTPAAATLKPGEAPVRSGDGHASIYRIDLVEKIGPFERQ